MRRAGNSRSRIGTSRLWPAVTLTCRAGEGGLGGAFVRLGAVDQCRRRRRLRHFVRRNRSGRHRGRGRGQPGRRCRFRAAAWPRRAAGIRLRHTRPPLRPARSAIDVVALVQCLPERHQIAGDQGQLDVTPGLTAEILQHRPALQARLIGLRIPGQAEPIGRLPQRRPDDITDPHPARPCRGFAASGGGFCPLAEVAICARVAASRFAAGHRQRRSCRHRRA